MSQGLCLQKILTPKSFTGIKTPFVFSSLLTSERNSTKLSSSFFGSGQRRIVAYLVLEDISLPVADKNITGIPFFANPLIMPSELHEKSGKTKAQGISLLVIYSGILMRMVVKIPSCDYANIAMISIYDGSCGDSIKH